MEEGRMKREGEGYVREVFRTRIIKIIKIF
jgi:hypothetical protein